MITIKKIHIKNFRSIVDEVIDLNDINFFVGKNDCGKSNVLKALNLFFNDETDFGRKFDFSLDYSKLAKKVVKHAPEIKISIDIVMPRSFKENGIKTWTKVWRNGGLHYNNINDLFRESIKGITYLNRIRYFYIPAVKSDEYFKYLLSQVYDSMTQTADTTLRNINEDYSYQLQALTQELSLQLMQILHMGSAIQMPSNLNVLFRDLSFSTSDKYVNSVDLNQRGDGIKARHIPSILRYMQNNIEKNKQKNAVGSAFIWGFEEPENGVEYLSCFELADELYSYINSCQMLITTHSPAFYMKSEANEAKCFYAYKDENGKSQYKSDISQIQINENIGLLPLVSPYIEQERKKYLQQEQILKTQIDEINRVFQNRMQRILLLTEGKTDIKHIKHAFEQLKLEESLMQRFDYYNFKESKTLGEELGKLLDKLSQMPKTSVVIGIFDRDKHVVPNDKGKKYKYLGESVYRFNIPALENDERELNDKICIEHYYTNSEIETQTDHGHLYMGKDFNSHGLSNDNMFCFQNYSKNQSITPISIIDGSNDHLQKLSDDSLVITKDDFADYIINHPKEFNYDNFIKIFEIIAEIVNDDDSISKKTFKEVRP